MIRVALVEDNATVRSGLAQMLNTAPGFACVAACGSTEEALRRLRRAKPEVVLMDIHLPGASGIECVASLRTMLPGVMIIMLTVETDSHRVFESLRAGAVGYLVKHATPDEILGAIRQVHQGGAPMSGEIARMVVLAFQKPDPPNFPITRLSPRELQVLRSLARGNRNKEIATEMGVGVGTVNTYVRHIYEKLHVRSRAEAVGRLMGG
ncbi:MAG: response regulator transcription factor [Verrucomicrobiae bacterium]|nr:response regulator transcription factor [Verrucomicrobiae bacterium]